MKTLCLSFVLVSITVAFSPNSRAADACAESFLGATASPQQIQRLRSALGETLTRPQAEFLARYWNGYYGVRSVELIAGQNLLQVGVISNSAQQLKAIVQNEGWPQIEISDIGASISPL